jgi:hypothetical protein
VNRQEEALTAEEQGSEVGQVDEIGVTGDQGKVDLLVAEASQAKGRPMDPTSPRTIVPTPRDAP